MPVVTLRIFRTVSQIIFARSQPQCCSRMRPEPAQAQTPSATARASGHFHSGAARLAAVPRQSGQSRPSLFSSGAASVHCPRFSGMRIERRRRDDIKPCGVIREIVFLGVIVQEVYGPAITHLQKIGYREGVDLFIFDYDWRRSVFDNAARLEGFVREKIPDPAPAFRYCRAQHGRTDRARLRAPSRLRMRSWRACSAPARRSTARPRSMSRSKRAGARSIR